MVTTCFKSAFAALMLLTTTLMKKATARSVGCCSHDYKSCVDWCGNTPEECNSSASFCYWLDDGDSSSSSCTGRWASCNPSAGSNGGCCGGLTCHFQFDHYQCLPTRELGQTATPTETVAPTLAPTKAPTPKPTETRYPTKGPTPFDSELLWTSNAMPTWDIFKGLDILTNKIQENPPLYSVTSSGGAAGGVVSESQGYGLFVTGAVLASWDTHAGGRSQADRQVVLQAFHGFFNGWKKMCQNSAQGSCQDRQLCVATDGTASVCLPGWKHTDDLSSQIGSGAAPDGDEDALVGMIFAVKAVENDPSKPTWYNEVRSWIDASVTAFMMYNTVDDGSGWRLLKLGSCWGGWEGQGQNPSYHSPGSYKLFRDFQLSYPESARNGYSGFSRNDWDALIQTSYEVLRTVACPDRGMVPNWARIRKDGAGLGIEAGSFSGSGTPQYEFGAEASRTIWRLALDASLYPQEAADPYSILQPLLKSLDKSPSTDWSDASFSSCSTPGMAENIYIMPGWLWNGFMYGPIFSSLIVPEPSMEARQQTLLNEAGVIMSTRSLPTSYYPRCWILLGNLAIGGALSSAAGATDFPPAAPVPTKSPVKVPDEPAPTFSPTKFPTKFPVSVPTKSPVQSPDDTQGGCCSHNFKDCVSWDCGNSPSTCGSCNTGDAYFWLENGSLAGMNCLARWTTGCAPSACCPGLKCFDYGSWSQCMPE